MPDSTAEKKYRWIKSFLNGDISIKDMSSICPFSERAIKYWLANFRKDGSLPDWKTNPLLLKLTLKKHLLESKKRVIELKK